MFGEKCSQNVLIFGTLGYRTYHKIQTRSHATLRTMFFLKKIQKMKCKLPKLTGQTKVF